MNETIRPVAKVNVLPDYEIDPQFPWYDPRNPVNNKADPDEEFLASLFAEPDFVKITKPTNNYEPGLDCGALGRFNQVYLFDFPTDDQQNRWMLAEAHSNNISLNYEEVDQGSRVAVGGWVVCYGSYNRPQYASDYERNSQLKKVLESKNWFNFATLAPQAVRVHFPMSATDNETSRNLLINAVSKYIDVTNAAIGKPININAINFYTEENPKSGEKEGYFDLEMDDMGMIKLDGISVSQDRQYLSKRQAQMELDGAQRLEEAAR
jgi:hypothetical protein